MIGCAGVGRSWRREWGEGVIKIHCVHVWNCKRINKHWFWKRKLSYATQSNIQKYLARNEINKTEERMFQMSVDWAVYRFFRTREEKSPSLTACSCCLSPGQGNFTNSLCTMPSHTVCRGCKWAWLFLLGQLGPNLQRGENKDLESSSMSRSRY